MTDTKRMAFVFGDLTMTLSVDDIEQVYRDWETAHPGQTIKNMTSKRYRSDVHWGGANLERKGDGWPNFINRS